MNAGATTIATTLETTLPLPAAVRHGVEIDGVVSRVERRGKSLWTFEGSGLKKVGRGDVARVKVEGVTYRGELVAISPRRAILHISASRSDHGIDR